MTSANVPLLEVYAQALCEHAHALFEKGYARMDATVFCSAEEPAITGQLVAEMQAFLECPEAPVWSIHYSVHDDPPQNTGGKMGKARPRVDIEIERVSYGKRPRLCFEAKRLNSTTGHTLQKYLGSDGLGCFLTGKYPATHGEAGMLGYVQSGETDEWHERLKQQLASQGATETCRCSLPLHTCDSKHSLSTSGVITIHHILLPFVHRSK